MVMKTWQALVVGGICGAAVTLGVGRWVGPETRQLNGGAVAKMREVTAVDSKRKADAESVEDAILSVRAWAGSLSVRPGAPEFLRQLRIWAEHDPLAAREFVMSAERFPGRAQGLAVVLAVRLPRIDGHRLSPKEGLDQHDKEETCRGNAPALRRSV